MSNLNASSFAAQIEQFIKENVKKSKNNQRTPTNTKALARKENIQVKNDISFLNDLVPEDGFLLLCGQAICCVRELLWHEKADIQAQAFTEYGSEYFYNETFEIRKVLPLCVYWVYDIEKEKLHEDNVTKLFSEEFTEELWHNYQDYYELTAEEAGILYNSAYEYFKNKGNGANPVPSVVLEVDDLLHYVNMPYETYMALPCIKYQKYKIVLMARSHALYTLDGNAESNAYSLNDDDQGFYDQQDFRGVSEWMSLSENRTTRS